MTKRMRGTVSETGLELRISKYMELHWEPLKRFASSKTTKYEDLMHDLYACWKDREESGLFFDLYKIKKSEGFNSLILEGNDDELTKNVVKKLIKKYAQSPKYMDDGVFFKKIKENGKTSVVSEFSYDYSLEESRDEDSQKSSSGIKKMLRYEDQELEIIEMRLSATSNIETLLTYEDEFKSHGISIRMILNNFDVIANAMSTMKSLELSRIIEPLTKVFEETEEAKDAFMELMNLRKVSISDFNAALETVAM